MMMLGEVLTRAKHSAGELESWLDRSDPEFSQTVKMAASRANIDSTGLAREAVSEFDRFADEDAWSGLLRAIRDSADPGLAGLMVMIRWHLNRIQGASPTEV